MLRRTWTRFVDWHTRCDICILGSVYWCCILLRQNQSGIMEISAMVQLTKQIRQKMIWHKEEYWEQFFTKEIWISWCRHSEFHILTVYKTYISELCQEAFKQMAYKNSTILDLNEDPNAYNTRRKMKELLPSLYKRTKKNWKSLRKRTNTGLQLAQNTEFIIQW